MIRKLTTLLMSLIFVFSLSACGGKEVNQENVNVSEPAGQEETDTEETEAQETEAEGTKAQKTEAQGTSAEGGKTLVVYYSETGNTKAAADFIAEAMNADFFELEPVEAYSSADLDWTDDGSRVVYKHAHPDDRAVALVAETVPDWESYDTVFIGYPKMEYGFHCV